jgi:dTMP kinase
LKDDGSGKTTQRKLFKDWLVGSGYSVTTTKWNSSKLIKPIIKARKNVRSLNQEEFCLLHAADFRHRLEHEVIPALIEGKMVVADRFLFTALARDAARGLELDWLLHIYSPLYWPDVVFYFSVSPETSGKRIAATRTPKYYEAGKTLPTLKIHSRVTGSLSAASSRNTKLSRSFSCSSPSTLKSDLRPAFAHSETLSRITRRPWPEWNEEAIADWVTMMPRSREAGIGTQDTHLGAASEPRYRRRPMPFPLQRNS